MPMVNNQKLNTHDGDPFEDGKLYCSMVGELQYVTINRPEIDFSVIELVNLCSHHSTHIGMQ